MNNLFSSFNQTSVIRFGKIAFTLGALAASVWITGCRGGAADGSFFVEKGCVECHSVSSFGVVSKTNVGPDLALAVEDAPKRFGKSLDMFWMNPSGTMQMVLSSKIKLTADEKDQALDLLKAAYEKKMQERARK
ncbi:MAG TPA: hypothetical protein VFD58_24510 [Blastocatellia bacterium]|nr:hypothetical protein [Blastocatellia bacterium]